MPKVGMSIRAYAKKRGVSHVAVLKAIESGRITPLPDGSIDPARADAQWDANTLPKRRQDGAHAAPVEAASQPLAGKTSLLQARTLNEMVKAQTNELRLAILKGEMVDRARAVAHVFKLAREERDAWLNWPHRIAPALAAQLGVDEHALFIALDNAVRKHLDELGEIKPKVDA